MKWLIFDFLMFVSIENQSTVFTKFFAVVLMIIVLFTDNTVKYATYMFIYSMVAKESKN